MGSNFTGREHDHDVTENPELVSKVIDVLNKDIAETKVKSAQSEVVEAVNALNNVNGMADYVGAVNISEVESIFTEITTSVKALGEAMQSSADAIKEYDESEWYEKAGSTILMSLCKVGEGLLNIVEDLGDGAMSLIGFVTNDWFGTGAMSSAIKAEWSHDVFNGYYNSDLAKKSAFTEDSGLANGIKVVSTTAGYIAIAACTAGVGSGLAAGGAAATFASSTTIANTVIAGVAGLGSGTESGLRQDKSFYEAFVQNGLTQGATQAAIAFAAGKFGEHLAKAKAVKVAQTAADEADDMVGAASKAKSVAMENFGKAQTEVKNATKALEAIESRSTVNSVEWGNAFDRLQNAKSALSSATTEKELAESFLERQIANSQTAHTALTNVSNAKAATFQGYSDKITNKFFDKGYKAGSNWRELGFVQGTKANAAGVVGDVVDGVKTIASPVIHPIQTAKTVGSAVIHPIQTVKSIPSAALSAAKTINPVTSVASVPGLVAATGNTAGSAISQNIGLTASRDLSTVDLTKMPEQPYAINESSAIDQRIDDSFGLSQPSQPSQPSDTTPSQTPSTTTPSDNSSSNRNNTSGYSTNGSSSNGGGYQSGSSSPSYQDTKTDDTAAQLKKDVEEQDAVKDVPKQEEPTTPTTTTPAVETPQQETPQYGIPQQESPAAVVTAPSGESYGGTTYHTGGGYSGEGYTPVETGDGLTDLETDMLNPLDESLLDNSASIDEIVKGSKYTKIPTSSKPITTTTSTGSGSSAVIPIAAGLSAAAAAGIGAKAYMDRKKNNDFDDEDDDFETEEWSGDEDDSTGSGIKYDETSDTQTYLDDDDDYTYEADTGEKYGARSSEDLADLQ